jgi:fructokinase
VPQVVCLGEALIDFVSTQMGVELIDAPGFLKAPGGAPANVAVGCARLGLTAGFMGKVGDDPFGRFLTRTFCEAGVDTSRVCYDTTARTGLAFVSLTADGERDFVFYRHPSADMLLRPDEIDASYVAAADVFHYGSITMIGEPSRSATLRAIEVARQSGNLISYDPNLRESLWDSLDHARAEIAAGMRLCHVAKVSEEELELVTEKSDIEAGARQLVKEGVRLVAVTRGPAGCYFDNGRATGWLDGFAVDVADTTGCGDGFVAAMLLALVEAGRDPASLTEDELRPAFRLANAVGALTATVKGAIPGLPTRAAAEAFLESRDP